MKKIFISLITLLAISPALRASGNPEEPESKTATPNYSVLAVQGSSYSTAVGIRAIGTSGITIKHFTRSSRAIEGIVGFWPDAFSATLLLENYANAFDEPGLNWYYGFGGHLAGKSDWVDYEGPGYRRADGNVGLGVDGIFGIEYKIREIPIAVSFDVKPFLEVTTGGNAFVALDPGLGVKVAF